MKTHYLPAISKLVQNSTGSYRTIAYSEEYQNKNITEISLATYCNKLVNLKMDNEINAICKV